MTTNSSSSSSWRPILDGELAEQASVVIGEIADALRQEATATPDDKPDLADATNRSLSHPALGGGLSGVSLFFAYLHEARPGEGYDDLAADLLDRAIDRVSEHPSPPWLYGGFPGVAWVGEHLLGRLFEPDPEEDAGEEIAAALAKLLEHSPWKRDYDLISGLVGLGVYALERLPRPGGEECLRLVLDRLAETSEQRPEGITWWTNPELLPEETRVQFPQGNYNLGVAHGVPGVIGFLGEVCAAGVAVDQARPLLDGAVRWVLANQLPPGSKSRFGYNVTSEKMEEPVYPSRLAWCYGDLGLAVALMLAGQGAGESEWEKEALAVARVAAARTAEDSGVMDAGLCHGSAGDAHLFNRLYQASGDPAMAQAARFWYQETFRLRHPGEPFAGFPSWGPQPGWDRNDPNSSRMGWVTDPGFLTGAAGVGLALLAAITPIDPLWDRLLAVSARPK